MTSDLSIFAARLRDFISICADEPSFGASPGQSVEPALQAHFDVEFNAMALVLFALQFQQNAAFRKFCEARRVFPDAIARWTEIPSVPTTAFKEFELTCLPVGERTAVFHSSGTTGQSFSRHFHSAESLALYEASLWPWFRAHLLPDLTPDPSHLTLLAPPPSQAPHSSLAHMFQTVWSSAFRRQGAEPSEGGTPNDAFAVNVSSDGAWLLDTEKVARALERSVETRQPIVLLGTAFSFIHLVDYLAEQDRRFDLPPGSRVMETGGYKGRSRSLPKAELHALLTRRLGISPDHVVCEYGMSELSSQAYDCRIAGLNAQHPPTGPSRLFRFPPWARALVVSPETGREVAEGETGLLRICDLANVFSVMAIQTEDLAIRRGNEFELIGRAESSEPRGCSLMSADA